MIEFVENKKILYVDDEKELLNSFASLLRKENLQVFTLQDSTKIDEMIAANGPFAVVFSDQKMPEYDGVQVLDKIRSTSPSTIRILITGYSDFSDTIRAINQGGISSYISKPWSDEVLKDQIKEWITQFNLKVHNQFLLNQLDEENKKLNQILDGTVGQTIRVLGDLTNRISPQVAELSDKVKRAGIAFLKAFPNLNQVEKWEILRALDLFNFGIALLPANVQGLIEKHGIAVLERSALAHSHHLLAAGLLKGIPRFYNIAKIIELQEKNFNGTGEPFDNPIKGNELPFGSRFLHILIHLAKQTSHGKSGTDVLKLMEEQEGKYDSTIIKQILGKIPAINAKQEERKLSVSELTAGMVVIDDVRSREGQILLKSQSTLSETLLNILFQWHSNDPIEEPIRVLVNI